LKSFKYCRHQFS